MITNERFATLFLNWWEMTERDMTFSEMVKLCKDIGTTRAEFIELISRSGEFISKDGWAPDPNTIRKSERQDTPTKTFRPWYAWDSDGKPVEDDEQIERGDADYVYILTVADFKVRFNDWIITDGITQQKTLYKWCGEDDRWMEMPYIPYSEIEKIVKLVNG